MAAQGFLLSALLVGTLELRGDGWLWAGLVCAERYGEEEKPDPWEQGLRVREPPLLLPLPLVSIVFPFKTSFPSLSDNLPGA